MEPFQFIEESTEQTVLLTVERIRQRNWPRNDCLLLGVYIDDLAAITNFHNSYYLISELTSLFFIRALRTSLYVKAITQKEAHIILQQRDEIVRQLTRRILKLLSLKYGTDKPNTIEVSMIYAKTQKHLNSQH